VRRGREENQNPTKHVGKKQANETPPNIAGNGEAARPAPGPQGVARRPPRLAGALTWPVGRGSAVSGPRRSWSALGPPGHHPKGLGRREPERTLARPFSQKNRTAQKHYLSELRSDLLRRRWSPLPSLRITRRGGARGAARRSLAPIQEILKLTVRDATHMPRPHSSWSTLPLGSFASPRRARGCRSDACGRSPWILRKVKLHCQGLRQQRER